MAGYGCAGAHVGGRVQRQAGTGSSAEGHLRQRRTVALAPRETSWPSTAPVRGWAEEVS
jgi:hypothetical protein